jgi:transcriptional pleiotropic regulator of transition state genes
VIKLKATGIVRRVDDLGRIVIPKELRKTMDISEGDPLEIFIDGGSVMFKKYEPACIFCGEVKGVMVYKGKNICQNCMKELRA